MKNCKQILCIVIVVLFVIITIPSIHILSYIQELVVMTDYIFDDSSNITVKSLIQESGYKTEDFWFKNNNYEEKAIELFCNTGHEYYNKLTMLEKVFAKEILMEPVYDFSLSEEILGKLSGQMQCLSKTEALFLLTKNDMEVSLGRICLTLSASPAISDFDEKLSSIDLLLIDNIVYALVTYNTALESISLYQLDIPVAELTTNSDFTPYIDILERQTFKSFSSYLSSQNPFLYINTATYLLLEYVLAFLFILLGYLVCRIKKSNK